MRSKTSAFKMILLVTLVALIFSTTLVPAGFAAGVKRGMRVKYSEFTGLDHTIWFEEKEGRYADNVSDARNEWTKVGTSPYVNEIDNPTNYIKATADSQEIGDFKFSTSPDGAIKEVYIELYCKQYYDEYIRVWYSTDGGMHWTNSGTVRSERTWEWRDTGDESANIDTWAKVNSLLVYLESVAKDVWYEDATVEVDCMRLRIISSRPCYAPPNLWNLTWSKPDYWPEINTESISMTVQKVSGTERSLSLTTHFENGSEEDKTLDGDVATGLGNLGFFFIEPNLEEGDEIMWDHTKVMGTQTSAIKLYINGTVSREYAGVSREVNYVDVVIPSTSVAATYVNLTAFWDKSTGVLCEISMAAAHGPISILRDRIDAWTSFKMTEEVEPPIWTEWWFWVIIAAVVVIVSGILVWRRRKASVS